MELCDNVRLVEQSRLKQKCEYLEKEKNRRVAALDGSIRRMQKHYEQLQYENHTVCYTDLKIPHGFRFRRNGDARLPRGSTYPAEQTKPGSSTDKDGTSNDTNGLSPDVTAKDVLHAISIVDTEFSLPKSHSQSKEVDNRLRNARDVLRSGLRGDHNTLPLDIISSKGILAPGVKTMLASLLQATHSSDRFSKHNHKMGCTACQMHTKYTPNSKSSHKIDNLQTKRWNSVPQGYFVPPPYKTSSFATSRFLSDLSKAPSQNKCPIRPATTRGSTVRCPENNDFSTDKTSFMLCCLKRWASSVCSDTMNDGESVGLYAFDKYPSKPLTQHELRAKPPINPSCLHSAQRGQSSSALRRRYMNGAYPSGKPLTQHELRAKSHINPSCLHSAQRGQSSPALRRRYTNGALQQHKPSCSCNVKNKFIDRRTSTPVVLQRHRYSCSCKNKMIERRMSTPEIAPRSISMTDLKNRANDETRATKNRVGKFLNKLPPSQPFIHKWRTSSGTLASDDEIVDPKSTAVNTISDSCL